MNSKDELYYLLGRLEGLNNKKTINTIELNFIQNILHNNPFFKVNKGKIEAEDNEELIDDYDDGYDSYDSYYYDDNEPFMLGDPRYDRNENPWIDVFGEGDEAEAAYWNTD